MSWWRLDIAYDGGGFRGWARQPGQRTVQEDLEQALKAALRQEVSLTAAGRTDAGVHALGQVASFELPDERQGQPGPPQTGTLKRSLNALTAADITVTQVRRMEAAFDARRDAKRRRYVYRLETSGQPSPFERGRALWWPYPIDHGKLDRCAQLIVGKHDFTAFTPTKTAHVHFERQVFEARWQSGSASGPVVATRAGDLLEFGIAADAFMRSMVRCLVGTMLEVAGGHRTVEGFARLLQGAARAEAGETAPPHGLYLAEVGY